MPADLTINADSNIKGVVTDVDSLNKGLDKTDDKLGKVKKNSKGLGDNMKKIATTFIIGGAFQRGVSKVLSDIDKSNKGAKELADSLRTLRFLGNAEEVASAQRLQSGLSRFGIQPEQVGPAAANVLSTAGGLPLATREQILRESGAAQAGGIGAFGGFSDFLATGSQAAPQFQSPAGITQLANLGAQGITEAKLPPERVGALTKALLIGLNGGLSAPEAMSAFAVLSKIESTDDAANEKLKQILKSWAVTGARDNGISFIAYVQATAEKGIKDLVGEEVTLQGPTLKPFAKQAATFASQTKRLATAQGGVSITERAFQAQLADPQTRQNILNEEQQALRKLIVADPTQRAGTEGTADIVSAGGEGLSALLKTGLSLSPAGGLASLTSLLSGGAVPDIGGALRSSAGEDVRAGALDLSFATRALDNNTNSMNNIKASTDIQRTQEAP